MYEHASKAFAAGRRGGMRIRARICAKRPLTVVISTETPTLKAGSPLEIKAELTNLSEAAVNVGEAISRRTGQRNNWLLDVRDAKGSKVQRKNYEHEELASWKIVFRELKPRQSLTDPLMVSRLYDLVPGKYSIQVARAIPNEAGGGLAFSNVLAVEVTAP